MIRTFFDNCPLSAASGSRGLAPWRVQGRALAGFGAEPQWGAGLAPPSPRNVLSGSLSFKKENAKENGHPTVRPGVHFYVCGHIRTACRILAFIHQPYFCWTIFAVCSIAPSVPEKFRIVHLEKICKFLDGVYFADTTVDISAYRANIQPVIVGKILLGAIVFLYQPPQGIPSFLPKR